LTGARRWVLATGLALAVAGPAGAHSLLLESAPSAGATLATPPPELMLRFNNRIEK
jgi:methionine-rich copper-binding protein CopC